jgi:tetratricopeptide (TPR) repeat protein
MGFWRNLADSALDAETRKSEQEQLDWIPREPANPRPYYHLAQLRRMQWKQDEGLALLLQAVRLNPSFADAHVALTEIYAVRHDYRAAWRHARAAAGQGNDDGVQLLTRHGIEDPAGGV